jgi:hypothetical protein
VRKRLGYGGALLSALTRIFVKTLLGFYRERGGAAPRGQCGAVAALQRTSSDLKLFVKCAVSLRTAKNTSRARGRKCAAPSVTAWQPGRV